MLKDFQIVIKQIKTTSFMNITLKSETYLYVKYITYSYSTYINTAEICTYFGTRNLFLFIVI